MKMKQVVLAFWIVLALVAIPEIVMAADPDMNGKWIMELQDPNKTVNPVFILNQDGTNLSGKYMGRLGEADITGRVRGIEVEIAFTNNAGIRTFYKGTVDGNRISGTADYNGFMLYDFIGEKQ